MTAPTTRWVATTAELDDVVSRAAACDRYFLDTEFHRERTYHPHLALVQLTWPGGDIALIDPLAVDPAPLARLLAGPGLAVLHPPSSTVASLPEYETASGCLLLPGLPHLGLAHRAAWNEADSHGTVTRLAAVDGIDPEDDADTAALSLLLAS